MSNEHEPTHRGLPASLTLNDLTASYIVAVEDGEPMTNPIVESMVYLEGKGWCRVSWNATHEWVAEIPPEALEALRDAQAKGMIG